MRNIELYDTGAYLVRGTDIIRDDGAAAPRPELKGVSKDDARKGTIAYGILAAHDASYHDVSCHDVSHCDQENLRLKFDSLASHDITYVGIIQTARASGMEKFPVPFVMTNCHNSLCAVGGTINQDDHVFALSAAKKYGGIYVPPHLAVIHTYNREMMAGCGKMILGSDSHTRYGALGTLAVGEGGGELAKQLVGRTYDIARPQVVAVYLTGAPAAGVGPHDVALAIIAAVFKSGYVKNKVMEFVGDGVAKLPVDFCNCNDAMTTETTCWSSVWKTDACVRDYLEIRGRGGDYRELKPADIAYYDGLIHVDLSKIEPCIALPFHPSNVYTIRELRENAKDILAKTEEEGLKTLGMEKKPDGTGLGLTAKARDGGVWAQQAVIVGCSGGIFDNIMAAADIINGGSTGSGNFTMSVYPESQPVYLELVKNGAAETFIRAGVLMREAFCGPCFGAGDTPANGELSIRHATRNFPNREGSKPNEGQTSFVALMDARSIAATALNNGKITAATDIQVPFGKYKFFFDRGVYDKRVYNGTSKPIPETELVLGPNIRDWPAMPALAENILVKIVSFITDPVTTTDELIPSGETSSYRSNPLRLAEFTLSRKDPAYVHRAKDVKALEDARLDGRQESETAAPLAALLKQIQGVQGCGSIGLSETGIGSAIFARKPGDGSAREQAASCQRVLGASANFALEYATKRYRSNLINWGILPFVITDEKAISPGSWVFFPGIQKQVLEKAGIIKGYVLGDKQAEIAVTLGELTDTERQILLDGCLINYYREQGSGNGK
jgi:aconitate hydratase